MNIDVDHDGRFGKEKEIEKKEDPIIEGRKFRREKFPRILEGQ